MTCTKGCRVHGAGGKSRACSSTHSAAKRGIGGARSARARAWNVGGSGAPSAAAAERAARASATTDSERCVGVGGGRQSAHRGLWKARSASEVLASS